MQNPREFKPARGVKWVKLLNGQPEFIKRERLIGARAQGMRYEKKALDKIEVLSAARGAYCLRSPWIEFQDDSGKRWCQPDCLVMNQADSTGVIIEVKYRHTSDAWFQLWHLYMPVMQKLFPQCRWGCVEMVKWYDPAVSFPEQPRMTTSPLVVPDISRTAVHIWNPARD